MELNTKSIRKIADVFFIVIFIIIIIVTFVKVEQHNNQVSKISTKIIKKEQVFRIITSIKEVDKKKCNYLALEFLSDVTHQELASIFTFPTSLDT